MNEFINAVLQFFNGIYETIIGYFNNDITTFLNKNIINGELITINLTYNELLKYLIGIVAVYVILALFIKYICKLINIIKF